jgi:IclR family pca regulon transcriptional regulator
MKDLPEHPSRLSASLSTGLAVLRCFTAEHPVRGNAEIADDLDMACSTTHRYASTLATLGYLEQGPSRKYWLSSRVSDVALAMLNSIAVRRVAREYLQGLRVETARTVSLWVLGSTKVVCIDRSQGSGQGQYAVDVGIGPGIHLPVHCSAAGKALLVRLTAAEQQRLITGVPLARHTPKTITTQVALCAELKRIARDVIVVEDEELLVGRRAIAAVVEDAKARPVAAVELVVPAGRYTQEEVLEDLGPKVAATARRIGSWESGRRE